MKTLILGAAIVDVIMKIDALPQKGDDIPCKYTKTQVGGCAYNVAKIMSLHNAAFDLFVPIGSGVYADIILDDLNKNSITPLLKFKDRDNGYCLSLVENDGERTFITVTGIEEQFEKEWFDILDMQQYQNIYVAGYQVLGDGGYHVASWLTSLQDKNIFFAPGPVVNTILPEVMSLIMSCSPIVHLNEKEALEYSKKNTIEDATKLIYENTQNYVIVTLGKKGVYIYDGTKAKIVTSGEAEVVDTIGAGDSHIATIISKYDELGIYNAAILANQVSKKMVSIEGSTMSKKEFLSINLNV